MRLSKATLVGAGFLIACSTAHADFSGVQTNLTSSDFSILSTGTIAEGNSWAVNNIVLSGSGFDLLVVEVTGAQFEAPGISFNEPASWSGSLSSLDTLYASDGGVNTSGFDFDLLFLGDIPAATDEVSIFFSAYLPGADTAVGSLRMDFDGTGFAPPFTQDYTTSVRRSSLHVAPVPGAVYLAGLGIGLVGFLRKRLA